MLFPILATRDLAGLLGSYHDLLGFTATYEYPGPDGEPGDVRFVADCDATVAALRAAGVPVVDEPADEPWGERIARVLDPDGNAVIVDQ